MDARRSIPALSVFSISIVLPSRLSALSSCILSSLRNVGSFTWGFAAISTSSIDSRSLRILILLCNWKYSTISTFSSMVSFDHPYSLARRSQASYRKSSIALSCSSTVCGPTSSPLPSSLGWASSLKNAWYLHSGLLRECLPRGRKSRQGQVREFLLAWGW